MKIAVVGTGYVGLVAGVAFSDTGNSVICVDKDERKVKLLREGVVPIYEPGLAELMARNSRAGRLTFTTDLEDAVRKSRVIILAVGTPQSDDGSADLSAIEEVARVIGRTMDGYRVVVMKSTVPVGTHARVEESIRSATQYPFDYVSNPEFMKEGAALDDFTRPDRVVIGVRNQAVVDVMRELYGPYMRRSDVLLVTDPASAEMIKYAANAMLAARISFMNEIACLCEETGADVEQVRKGVGSDSRIGDAFLYPGVGFGGSCFPKDVRALASCGETKGLEMTITHAVRTVNERQQRRFAQRVIDHFGDHANKTKIAVWGLAFKSRTDDVRESPALSGIRMFLQAGMKVTAHDPEAMPNASAELGDAVGMSDDGYEALAGADALVVFTDWAKFRSPDFDLMAEKMAGRQIFDGRNLYNPATMARRGFTYHSVGRPTAYPA